MNRFFKIRTIIAFICIIIALCVVSLGIAIKISATMLEKKDNIVRTKTGETHTASSNTPKNINFLNRSKAEKLDFYFNGLMQEEFICYKGENGEVLFPLDLLLRKLSINYKVLNSDDTLMTQVSGKSLVIRLNSLDASYGGENYKLDVASVSADGHVFVSSKILDCFENNVNTISVLEDALFFNNWKESQNKDYENFRLLKLSGSELKTYYIFGRDASAKTISGISGFEAIYPVTDTVNYLIKAGSNYYMLDSSFKAKLLTTGAYASLSEKHEHIYWTDKNKKRLYIYDVKSGKTNSYRNYFARIAKSDSSLSQYDKLYDFDSGNGYIKFDLLGKYEGDIYTIILRNGKVVAEGKSNYSPDGKKLAYFVKDKGFYTAYSDGTGIAPAGIGQGISWIDNNRVIINDGTALSVFDTVSKGILPVDITRILAGKAINGDVFSIRDGMLYSGAGRTAKQLFKLPWDCSFIYAPSGNGPYVILSMQQESVYCLSNNSSFLAAQTGKFINGSASTKAEELFRMNSAVTADNSKIAFLQNENGMLQVNLVDIKSFKFEKVVIDCQFKEKAEGAFELFWLDSSRLLLHSGNQGWVLDMKQGTHVYSWEEPENGILKGLLEK